ncbi:MAG: bifunctional riboflavin kinase/FMN adenylyltransferase [Bacteroidales bacterium]|nr:bifunctional riboflavin kinase/FMN adenylyltransferase [Bacteroidales bacterium]
MAVVTTGFFDGVHLGHREVIKALVSSARERGEEAVVVTFWPHPRTVLQQDARDFRILTTLDEKKERLASLGVDRVEVIPFTRAFAALTARDYLAMLRERYSATRIVMGYDNRIGTDRLTATDLSDPDIVVVGRVDRATDASAEEGLRGLNPPQSLIAPSLPLSPASPQQRELVSSGPLPLMWPRVATGSGSLSPSSADASVAVSSTRIREALSEGRVEDAEAMLGYRYSLCGAVVAGNRLGRTIGFPTANMQLYEPLKLIPGNGVYAVEAEVLGSKWRGMTNIGVRPTVGGSSRTVETHLLAFDEDIYGLPLRITFLRKLRDEIRFPSLAALKEQLAKDRTACAWIAEK